MVSDYQAKIIEKYTGYPASKAEDWPLAYDDVYSTVGELFKKTDAGMDELVSLIRPFINKPNFTLTLHSAP